MQWVAGVIEGRSAEDVDNEAGGAETALSAGFWALNPPGAILNWAA